MKRNRTNISQLIKAINPEAFIWVLAIVSLAYANPYDHHFTLCPLGAMGIEWCPGCGLGRSISMIFRGDLLGSFHTHPLGLICLGILSFRIVTLFKLGIKTIKNGYE